MQNQIPINYPQVAELVGTNQDINWLEAERDLAGLLSNVFSSLAVQYFDPTPKFKTVVVKKVATRVPDGFTPAKPTELLSLETRKSLVEPSSAVKNDWVWASESGFSIPDFTFKSLGNNLREGYLAEGVKILYSINGSGKSSFAVVHAIDIAFNPEDDDPNSLVSTRFISEDGIRINTNAGAGAIPGRSAAVSGTFDLIEEVRLEVIPGSAILSANRVELEGMSLNVGSGTPSAPGDVPQLGTPALSGWFETPEYTKMFMPQMQPGGVDPMAPVDPDFAMPSAGLTSAQLRSLLAPAQGEEQTLTFSGTLYAPMDIYIGGLPITLNPWAEMSFAGNGPQEVALLVYNQIQTMLQMPSDPGTRPIYGLVGIDYPSNGTLKLQFDPSLGDVGPLFEDGRVEFDSGNFSISVATTKQGIAPFLENPMSDGGSSLIFASNHDGVINGTELDDNIALNKAGSVVDLRQGPNGHNDDSDTLFFNLGPLKRYGLPDQRHDPLSPVQTVQAREVPASFELTQKGSYQVKGFGVDDRMVIGLRVLDESGTYHALERIVTAGNFLWLELTEKGKELAMSGRIESPELLIDISDSYPFLTGESLFARIETPQMLLRDFGGGQESALVLAGVQSGLSLSNADADAFPRDIPVVLLMESMLNEQGRLELVPGSQAILVSPASAAGDTSQQRYLALDISGVDNIEANWSVSGFLNFTGGASQDMNPTAVAAFSMESQEPLLMIANGALNRLGIYDGKSLVDYNLISPNVTGTSARFDGTNGSDLILPVEGLRSVIDAGGGNDLIAIGNVVGSIASGGDGFNQMDAPDARFEAVAARAFTLNYVNAKSAIFANLDLGVSTFSGGTDFLSGAWSNVIGSNFDDTIVGNEFGNELYGGGGNDHLYGRQQRDWMISMPAGTDPVAMVSNYWLDTTDYAFGGTGNDTYYVELNQFSKIAAHEFAGEGDNDVLQVNGTGAGLWDLASIVASAGGYEYRQNAYGTDLGYTQATLLRNTKTDIEFSSLTRNIEKISIAGSSDFRNSKVFTFDVGYGNGSSAGDGVQLVLPSSSGTHLMNGGGGNDVLVGSSGANVYMGGSGDDIIFAMGGQHRVMGGAGDDMVWVKPQAERSLIHLGQGKDAVVVDVDDLLSGASPASMGTIALSEYSRNVDINSAHGGFTSVSEDLTGYRKDFQKFELVSIGLEQVPLVISSEYESIPYFHNADGDHQFGRMMASLSDPLLEDLVFDIYRDWYNSGGLFGDLGGAGHSTVLDFRVDEDTLLLAANSFFVDGPDYLSMTFTDGDDVIVNRFFEKQELMGNGSAAASVIHFDKYAGMVGWTTLSGYSGYTGNERQIYTKSADLVQLVGMQGATKPAVEMMFENAGFLGYQEVNRESFLIGLSAIDEASAPFYNPYA